MTQIPTPPTSRPGSEAPDVNVKPTTSAEASVDLAQCLDLLLEQYLRLLDRQQKLQSSLAERLSSGFIALAQANFSSPPGRRYGPDYYDERMKATRKISIQSERTVETPTTDPREHEHTTTFSDSGYTFSVLPKFIHQPEPDGNNQIKIAGEVPEGHPEAFGETTSPQTTSSEPPNRLPLNTPLDKQKPRTQKSRSTDPIHWYGILVPPSLRRAQDSFAHAIDNQVPDLASTIVQMRALEQQINQIRVQLESEPSATTRPGTTLHPSVAEG